MTESGVTKSELEHVLLLELKLIPRVMNTISEAVLTTLHFCNTRVGQVNYSVTLH